MCDSQELLVGYLYDDLDGADRRAFDVHLAACP
jgi:anti-sigma factor RsiW